MDCQHGSGAQYDHGTTSATHWCAKRDNGRPTQELGVDDPRTVTTGPRPQHAHGLDNADGVHVGKDDLDVGTRDQVNEYDDL